MADPLLHIVDISQDGTTGHITLHAYIVEVDGETEIKGLPESHGIDPMSLHSLYGDGDGNVDKWLADVKKRMLDRHNIRKNIHSDLISRVGKRV